MHDRLKRFIVSLVIGLIAFIIPATATASSYQVLQCNNSGQVVAGTELLFDDPNAPANNASFCSEVNPRNASDKTIRIFSRVLCSFVSILNQVLGKVYCGIQFNLQKYIAIAITIYIAIFGVQILSGTAQMTTKELLTRFIKIGLVWAFVSNYNYGVNLLFVFFIDFANQSIWWTLGSVSDGSGNSIRDIMNLPTNPTETVSGVVPAYVFCYSGLCFSTCFYAGGLLAMDHISHFCAHTHCLPDVHHSHCLPDHAQPNFLLPDAV